MFSETLILRPVVFAAVALQLSVSEDGGSHPTGINWSEVIVPVLSNRQIPTCKKQTQKKQFFLGIYI